MPLRIFTDGFVFTSVFCDHRENIVAVEGFGDALDHSGRSESALRHRPDRRGVVRVGLVRALPLLVRLRVRLPRATSGEELRIRVHIRNLGSGGQGGPQPQPHSP
jgi:hypothetical protein